MPKIPKIPKIDGFGAAERKAVRSAVRLVWQRSRARQLALKRATDGEGFYRCEQCGTRVPKVHVDHRETVGEVDGPDYIRRMFAPSSELVVLCPSPCHREKTKRERMRREEIPYGP